MVTITAPIHLAAGKNGSPLVHVIAERAAVAATNGIIIAAWNAADCEGETPFSTDDAFTTRPFKTAWSASDGSIEVHPVTGGVTVDSDDGDTRASDISRERVVELSPVLKNLGCAVVGTEVWIDAAQLAKLAKALGASKGEPVKLSIPTQRGRGAGMIIVTRENKPEVYGGIMAAEELVDTNTGASALKQVPIALEPVGDEAKLP